MATNKKKIFLLLLLPALIKAKCNCIRPTRPIYSNVPVAPVAQPLPSYEQHQPMPVPNLPNVPIQTVPEIPVIEIPSLEEVVEEPVKPVDSVSKDDARKFALVMSSILATVTVVGGALFSKLSGNKTIGALQERMNRLNAQLAQCAVAVEQIRNQRGSA